MNHFTKEQLQGMSIQALLALYRETFNDSMPTFPDMATDDEIRSKAVESIVSGNKVEEVVIPGRYT